MGQRPIHTVRDGAIHVAIWRNEKADRDGFWYEAKPGRTYTDENEQAQTAQTFSGTDLLVLAEVTRTAYRWIRAQEAKDKIDERAAA